VENPVEVTVPETPAPEPTAGETPPEAPVTLPVDPARSAAGRRGGERFHELARLGREYEREHKLTPGRQRLKQLVQLGRRYEQEHGLAAKPRRRRRGDPWQEFLSALARVVRPALRPAVEQLAAALRQPGKTAA
jgi:hypothetical protein